MNYTTRTALEVLGVVVASCASVMLVYWILHSGFGLSPQGSLLLLVPATIVLAGTAVYGYYTGHQRFHNPEAAEERIRAFDRRFRIVTFVLLLVVPIILTAICLIVLQDIATAAVFAAIAAGTAPWTIRRIRGVPSRD